ncbi:kinesin light chain [Colletotrichum zoysiae]|uniref:Kinesin light chain n=1 Tax=Colletotrichum zoysiae TaxID=1216348 RepID=A0AAD9HCS7_9PEZI|nr:kinesin light chain [Colletotrichum zoysiae]
MSALPSTARKKLTHDAYRIGRICPLQVELQAALAMLDEVHETLPQPRTDPTVYKLGSINGHNIVIASLHQSGNCPAAMVATHMQSTFRNLNFGLLVSIEGGVPTESEAGMIRLGHIVVSKPTGAHSGAVNYSHGKAKDGIFERTGYINSPPRNIERILVKRKLRTKYQHPGVSKDHLHRPQDEETDDIIVHRGTIASGQLLLGDAILRDKLAKEHGVLCFEMEAAGALTDFRCLIIRGISDYCDAVQPRHFVVPFTRNREFVGREIFIEELRAKLCVDDGPRRIAVTGLGGIGKTQVALQMAFWFKENRPTWSIFWVPAYSMTAFEKACNDIVNSVDIQVAKDEDAKEAVQRFLNSRDAGNWLLIVDNADDDHTMFRSDGSPGINKFLPANEDGRIMFTSRFRKLASELAGKEVFELQKMSTPEARRFFENAMPREETLPDELVEELLAQLEHLPLAISQATAYLNNNSISTSLEDYLSILRGTEKEAAGLLGREYRDHTRYDDEDTGHAVATTWLVSFRHIGQMNDSGAAINLLKFVSQIGPTSIPLDLLPQGNTKEDLNYAIETLASFAFLSRRAGTDLFYMHRLVHLASRIWFEKEGLAAIPKTDQALGRCRGSLP